MWLSDLTYLLCQTNSNYKVNCITGNLHGKNGCKCLSVFRNEVSALIFLLYFWHLSTAICIFQASILRKRKLKKLQVSKVIVCFHSSTTWKKTLFASRYSNASVTFELLKCAETNTWLFLFFISSKEIQRM